MIVYHGGILEIRKPDVEHSKKYLDFGKGFYVTSFPNQAERWAIRKSERSGVASPVVSVYELKEDYKGFRTLVFRDQEDDEAWLDFVCSCREGREDFKKYDIIIGNVANDDVFKSVDMYRRGVWDIRRTLRELRYFKRSDQIAFISQASLDELLEFRYSYTPKDCQC